LERTPTINKNEKSPTLSGVSAHNALRQSLQNASSSGKLDFSKIGS